MKRGREGRNWVERREREGKGEGESITDAQCHGDFICCAAGHAPLGDLLPQILTLTGEDQLDVSKKEKSGTE